MIMKKEYETIIIGAGPAGIAAAIQLKRVGREFLIFEKGPIGGIILNANRVENYLGFANGPSGPELAEHFTNHLKSMNITVHHLSTGSLERLSSRCFMVDGYSCRNVIVASGTRARRLAPEIIEDGAEDRIYTEVYPIRDLADQRITIIGSGDAAFDYTLTLAPRNSVTILYRSNEPKCHQLLLEEASNNSSIEQLSKRSPLSITKEEESLKIKTDQGDILKTDYVLTAIGRDPAIDFCSKEIKNHFLEKSEVPGLYWVGDVARGIHRQVAIAVGDGIRAAMGIITE